MTHCADEEMRKPKLSKSQERLANKHGTPAEFARAVYKCVPGEISINEAHSAIDKYNREWSLAADTPGKRDWPKGVL